MSCYPTFVNPLWMSYTAQSEWHFVLGFRLATHGSGFQMEEDIDFHKRGTYGQGYLVFAKMYLELLLELQQQLQQELQQQLQQLQVHFGNTQVPLAIGTPFVKVYPRSAPTPAREGRCSASVSSVEPNHNVSFSPMRRKIDLTIIFISAITCAVASGRKKKYRVANESP